MPERLSEGAANRDGGLDVEEKSRLAVARIEEPGVTLMTKTILI